MHNLGYFEYSILIIRSGDYSIFAIFIIRRLINQVQMKTNLLFYLQISIILSFFLSCKGQEAQQTENPPETPPTTGTVVQELDRKIWAIFQDKNDNYWFGSNGTGVYLYDGQKMTQYTKSDGLVDNSIRGFQSDKAGNVYIETPGGVSKYDGRTFSTLKVNNAPLNSWMLTPDDLWFNCNGDLKDVYRYDGNYLYELKLPRADIKAAFGIDPDDSNFNPFGVYAIDKDKAGNVWFGTVMAGAFRYDGQHFMWFPEKELSTLEDGRVPGVRSILEDKAGNFWLSNFISKYTIIQEEGKRASYEKQVGIDIPNSALKDELPYFNGGLVDRNTNDLWMIKYEGGAWHYKDEKLLHYPVEKGAETAALVCIFQDNQGILWLGSDNAGVFKFNGETFEPFEG